MKKRWLSLALAALLALPLAGCGGNKAAVPSTSTETVTEAPTEAPEPYLSGDARSIAVMIDNDGSDSWPHWGLSDAYLVYEMYVEGGSTRLMALFKDAETEKIGPVRSCRHYFLDYAMEHDAIYVAYGWSPKGQTDSNSLDIDYINGIKGTDDKYFWRDRKYKGDYHSAYTSIENILKGASDKGYETTSDDTFMDYHYEITPLEEGTQATSFKIPYAGHYSVTYNYDAENHYYTRTLKSSTPHESSEGVPFAPTNVIIMEVKCYGLGDADNPDRRQLDTVGSGKGYYITEGKMIPITWSKSSRSADTEFKDESGNPITLNPGQTFINLVNPGTQIEFK